jgi:hypothetical protein
MTRLIAITIACALTGCVLVGCGSPKTIAKDSPKATAEAFVEAMKSGDYDAIAAGWDYEIAARRDSSSWDDIPPGERKLIIGKLEEAKAKEVEALGGMMTGEVTVGEATVQGQRALVVLTAGQVTVAMMLAEVDGVWKVLQVAERAGSL